MNKVSDFLYEKKSYEIRGACFQVWNKLGSAFKESAIDRALTRELQKRNLRVEDQKRIAIIYDGEKIGSYVLDKVSEGLVVHRLERDSYKVDADGSIPSEPTLQLR